MLPCGTLMSSMHVPTDLCIPICMTGSMLMTVTHIIIGRFMPDIRICMCICMQAMTVINLRKCTMLYIQAGRSATRLIAIAKMIIPSK